MQRPSSMIYRSCSHIDGQPDSAIKRLYEKKYHRGKEEWKVKKEKTGKEEWEVTLSASGLEKWENEKACMELRWSSNYNNAHSGYSLNCSLYSRTRNAYYQQRQSFWETRYKQTRDNQVLDTI